MDISKRNGKRKPLPIIFYLFVLGVIMNILWLCYNVFTSNILRQLGLDSTMIRDFLVQYSYPIEWMAVLFAIIYYFITKKKVFGFWLMIFLSVILIIIPIIIFITNWNTGNPNPALV
jgi:hypothetical protein